MPKYEKRPDSECGDADGKGGVFRNRVYRTCGKNYVFISREELIRNYIKVK